MKHKKYKHYLTHVKFTSRATKNFFTLKKKYIKYPQRANSGSWYCSDRSETETDQQNRKKNISKTSKKQK